VFCAVFGRAARTRLPRAVRSEGPRVQNAFAVDALDLWPLSALRFADRGPPAGIAEWAVRGYGGRIDQFEERTSGGQVKHLDSTLVFEPCVTLSITHTRHDNAEPPFGVRAMPNKSGLVHGSNRSGLLDDGMLPICERCCLDVIGVGRFKLLDFDLALFWRDFAEDAVPLHEPGQDLDTHIARFTGR
jgi:hypothetical protein